MKRVATAALKGTEVRQSYANFASNTRSIGAISDWWQVNYLLLLTSRIYNFPTGVC
jgi:hypothetical protein